MMVHQGFLLHGAGGGTFAFGKGHLLLKVANRKVKSIRTCFFVCLCQLVRAQLPVSNKKGITQRVMPFRIYLCGRRDSNPHGCPLDPKSSASTNFATPAYTKDDFQLNSWFVTLSLSAARQTC